MKSINWLPLMRSRIIRVFFSIAMVAFWAACSDDTVDLSGPAEDAAGRKNKLASSESSNSNSESNYGDYTIVATRNGAVWTYVITKNPGAKGLSHFILDLDNCENNQTLSISSILWATVNGQPAVLEDSEGNTGCELTTTNFVKFDDLQDASVYTIIFELDEVYGNVLLTTGWLKAGTSCHA